MTKEDDLPLTMAQPVSADPRTDNLFIGDVARLRAERDQARAEAERLWGLLDDISTLGDQLKPEINHYFNAIHRKVEKRHGIITSDGYTLKWSEPAP
jgi:hypothetical protein